MLVLKRCGQAFQRQFVGFIMTQDAEPNHVEQANLCQQILHGKKWCLRSLLIQVEPLALVIPRSEVPLLLGKPSALAQAVIQICQLSYGFPFSLILQYILSLQLEHLQWLQLHGRARSAKIRSQNIRAQPARLPGIVLCCTYLRHFHHSYSFKKLFALVFQNS